MRPTNSSIRVLVERLCRPQSLGVFGNRGVGKSTLLTMLYREAVCGRLPDLRMAAADARTAEYFSDKIRQLESGALLPGTLAETELKLHLYQGQARIELIVKDYQGEHVELGRQEPIHDFFRDCDAVWLCLDADTDPASAAFLRRQQEVELLIEDYLKAEPGLTVSRPVALLLTKADLLQPLDEGRWTERMDMTCHALKSHCPSHGLFAVSCLKSNPEAPASFHLSPHDLSNPLAWLCASLRKQDEARLEHLFMIASNDLAVLQRCVEAFARRYPNAPSVFVYRQRLRELRRKLLKRRSLVGVLAASCLFMTMWTYDALGYQKMIRAQSDSANDPAAALGELRNYRDWHPTRNLLRPEAEREETKRLQELEREARQQARERQLGTLQRQVADPDSDVDGLDGKLREFRAAFPEVGNDDLALVRKTIQARLDESFARKARLAFDELARAEDSRAVDLAELLVRADRFLKDYAGSIHASDVVTRRTAYLRRLDQRDIEVANLYMAHHPQQFQTCREHYQRYLEKHPVGGNFTADAQAAIRYIERAWDRHDFWKVHDQYEQAPGDLVNLQARCRNYLAVHPSGKFAAATQDLLRWAEQVGSPRDYRVVVKSGSFEKKTARYVSMGPDLTVEVEVNGIRYGPSTICKNRYYPEWEYEFPRAIRWKLGDAVRIIVTDLDWKDRIVFDVASEDGDPVGLKLLTGDVWSGNNCVTFQCDFLVPVLPKIE